MDGGKKGPWKNEKESLKQCSEGCRQAGDWKCNNTSHSDGIYEEEEG
jgi:hypothetical protein